MNRYKWHIAAGAALLLWWLWPRKKAGAAPVGQVSATFTAGMIAAAMGGHTTSAPLAPVTGLAAPLKTIAPVYGGTAAPSSSAETASVMGSVVRDGRGLAPTLDAAPTLAVAVAPSLMLPAYDIRRRL